MSGATVTQPLHEFERMRDDARQWREYVASLRTRKESEADRKRIEKRATEILGNLAQACREGKRVLAIHGLDANTWAVCDDEVDAEVIVQALNFIRAQELTKARKR